MPTLAIHPGSTIFVTGVNGLIGSHIVNQLLKRGYNVRGAVRNIDKNQWLVEYFEEKYAQGKFEMVHVPDMGVEGCYDEVLDDVQGFVHVAAPIDSSCGLEAAVSVGVSGCLHALKACAKSALIKRFVFTSSSIAATFPKPDADVALAEDSYNDEALEIVKKEPNKQGIYVYAAMKTQCEKEVWKWMRENKPSFTMNTVLPNVNFGRVLVPQHQGFPSTIEWARAAWTGEQFARIAQVVDPQWFISPGDSALLHVSALIYGDVESERLFGFAEPWNFNQLLSLFRRLRPDKKFPDDVAGQGVDRMWVPNQRAEEILRWVKGESWDSLEMSVKEMSEDWV